eukprot:TRINITY_DN5248_c0_g1_i1.p1 TRINITY_DN5248_c0_g1~~TRINITY_DN5248_c0_g1_i1.p1  ORF type:complete len:495 (-),score=76.15 TRINITY_DN5248_c0_g1_i1:355-1839(-)
MLSLRRLLSRMCRVDRLACIAMQQSLIPSLNKFTNKVTLRPSVPQKRQTVKVTAVAQEVEKFDAKAFRRSLNKSGKYIRNPTNNPESQQTMEDHGVGYSSSGLVAQMRANNNEWQQGDVYVKMAKVYGYCWGVERSVQMAYETRNNWPDNKVFLTNEIIHNPSVNQRMREMGIDFVDEEKSEEGHVVRDFSPIKENDVVLLPAFGASVKEMKELSEKGVQIVDTTCPWVSKVWNAVDKHARKNYTSIIHGKWQHEETVATASFATTYVIVKNIPEAEYVCNYILNGGDKQEFLAKFKNALSEGFDPDTMLECVGLANQTTMLKGETQEIGKMLEKTMMQKYGPQNINEHFMIMDTICDATQERQDAMYELTANGTSDVDMILVVGGFNSSNTSHLQEIAEHKNIPSFWIDSAARINVQSNSLLHKTSWGELKETDNWLPEGPIRIGITSGASTPDRTVEDVLDKVFRIKDPSFNGIVAKEVGQTERNWDDHEDV